MGTWTNRIGGGLLEAPAGLEEVGSGVQLYAADWRQVVDNLAHGGRGLAQLLMGATGLQLAGTAFASGDTVPAGVWLLRDTVGYLIERRTTGPTAIEWIDTAGDLALWAVPGLRDDALVDPGDADAASADAADVRFLAQLAVSAAPTYGLKLGEGPATASSFTSFTEDAALRIPVITAIWQFSQGLRIGDGTDATFTISLWNADANKPGLRYNHTANAWEFSNDGTTWTAIGSVAGLMTDFDVAGEAGDVVTIGDADVLSLLGEANGFRFTGDGGGQSLTLDMLLASLKPGLEQFTDGYGNVGWRVKTSVRTAALQVIFDGGGSAISAGSQVDLYVPFDCTITLGALLNDASGSIVVDVWRDSYANYPPTDADSITASAPLTASSAVKALDSTLTGWSKDLTAGQTLRFNVDSCSGVTRCTVTLAVLRG